MGELPVPENKSSSSQIYRFSTAEIVAVCALCLTLYNRFSDSGRNTSADIVGSVATSESRIRSEYKDADGLIRTEIITTKSDLTRLINDTEARCAAQAQAVKADANRRLEAIEAKVFKR